MTPRPTYIDDELVFSRLSYGAATQALEAALRNGLDPTRDPPRLAIDLPTGQLLLMPSLTGGPPVIKLVTVGGTPWVQGVCVVFDQETLAPIAVIDATALTLLRTAALSTVVIRRLVRPGPVDLVVFGEGPQAHAHADALAEVLPIASSHFIGIGGRPDSEELVATAAVICCCTNSPTPLFDGRLVADDAIVAAIGSHEPHRRELDESLMRRASVVVESREAALREAGDVMMAVEAGALDARRLITLSELILGDKTVSRGGPTVFKSTGMAWEDAVVAEAIVSRPTPNAGRAG